VIVVKMPEEFLSFPEAPTIRTQPPGPLSKKAIETQNRYETRTRLYTNFFPMAVAEGKGSSIKDLDGNVFIDWFAGICVLNLGHRHPAVLAAMRDQLEKIVHINELPTEARTNFLETLVSTLPGDLRNHARVMFTVTGADAVEAGMSLARRITGKRTIVAFGGAYHGVHGTVVGATANRHYRDYAGVPPYEIYHLPYPYTYRFPVKVREGDESKAVIDMLEYIIEDEYSGVSPIAGVVVEPVQGEGGYIVPPDDFLPMLREVTERHSVPLIVDEVQSGVGRTGKIWASEHYGITPDIVCISKSIGGGIPLSMIAYRPEYDEELPAGFHLGTYRGNPLALAAGNAILNHLKSSDLLDRVTSIGSSLKARFQEISADVPQVGEVRGKGFMIGLELVTDRHTKEPASELAKKLRSELFQNGVLMHTCGHYANVMRFMAPLTIEKQLLDRGLVVFDRALHKVASS
jgi:2,4-diaminobutyrate 4-transaminase